MGSEFDVFDDGLRPALWHMEQDRKHIENLKFLQKPFVRLYRWQAPTITYGHFIDPTRYLRLDLCEALGFEVVRRPTGGGILFHENDITFSVAMPSSHPKFSLNVLENYQMINQAVLNAIHTIVPEVTLAPACEKKYLKDFCMAQPTQYDILLNGLKIGGAAQRKTSFGYVHQSSIFLSAPSWELFERLLHKGSEVVCAMKEVSTSLCGYGIGEKELIREKFLQAFLFHLGA